MESRMRVNPGILTIHLAAALLCVLIFQPLAALGQDLVPVSSLAGGSSVFVFRNKAKAIRRVVATARPTVSREQRAENARRVKRQYIARVAPRRPKAQTVDPVRNPVSKSLPPAQGAVRFAGVGEFYLEKGDINLALEAFRDALSLDETNALAKTGYAEALTQKGNDHLAKGQFAAAKAMFLEALKFDNKNSAAYFGLGEAYTELNEVAEAIANYEKALESDQELTEIYVPLGILYYQNQQLDKADELLTKAVANDPNSSQGQFFLGLIRLTQDRDEEALAAFNKAKASDPKNAEAFFNAAEALVKLKRLDDSIADYKKATELKPDYFEAWYGLGEVYFAQGDHTNAITAYKNAIRLKNTEWELFQALAESYRITNNHLDAEANYRLASLFLTREPDYDKTKIAEFNSKIGLVIGKTCDIKEMQNMVCDWSDAIAALQKAVDITDDPIDHVNLGWAYFRAGHRQAELRNPAAARPFLEKARSALEKAANSGPPAEGFALQNLASVYIDLGDNKMAIETLNKLLTQRPDLDFARYALGVAYFKNNDFVNAEKWFRTAIERDPKNPVYYMALGNALISRKDSKGLRALIERVRPVDGPTADELERKRVAFKM